MRRKKMSFRKSKKNFKRGMKYHKKNLGLPPTRGGYRL